MYFFPFFISPSEEDLLTVSSPSGFKGEGEDAWESLSCGNIFRERRGGEENCTLMTGGLAGWLTGWAGGLADSGAISLSVCLCLSG